LPTILQAVAVRQGHDLAETATFDLNREGDGSGLRVSGGDKLSI
jgi:hypothetical protein